MTDKQNFEKDINVPSKEHVRFEPIPELTLYKQKVETLTEQLARKTQELEVICKAFDIEYAYNDDGKIFGRSNKLRSLEQECEELKGRLEYIRNENKNLKDSATAEQLDYVSLKNYISTLEFAENRYRKALEEIEEIVKQTCRKRCANDCLGTKKHCGYGAIFKIVNKAKLKENEQ